MQSNAPRPVLPLRQDVLLPGTTVAIPVGRKSSVALARAVKPGDEVIVAVQRDPEVDGPALADLHAVAVTARVERVRPRGRGLHLVLTGLERVTVTELTKLQPFLVGRARPVEEVVDERTEAIADDLRQRLDEALEGKDAAALAPIVEALRSEDDAGRLADRTAAIISPEWEKAVELLLMLDVNERLLRVCDMVTELATLQDIGRKVQGQVRREMMKNQREAILREQLKAIQKELGDGDGDDQDGDALKTRLDAKDLPDDVRKVVNRELAKLGRAQGAEQGVVRNYLEWIADVPWTERNEGDPDLNEVQRKLDDDHAGLDDVKERILEHLAVLRVAGSTKGTVLCLAGPPGVGKTSLGQSVADALGRPFQRVALGGVRDEAEVRGHRRTYVGALPGRIVHALKKAEVKNPVLLLDEIDKLGKGWAGDPEAALLEVLDPEQNHTFTEHYMELPIDLSEVLFICTANDLSQLSAPLRDRLEIIELEGYVKAEKLSIARSHLIPQKLREHGLEPEQLVIDDAVLGELIDGWTKEAGVRQLARSITKLCRAVALKVARDVDDRVLEVQAADLKKLVGKRRFFDSVAERTAIPGVATGMAWTPVGGDLLFIETTRMRGSGKVETTGQLGDVMKESARAALSYVRSHAEDLGIDPAFLEQTDVHIHVPAGAVPKDGPSAGVTMFTALVSLLTGRKVRSDTAMTGEATLRGKVLPVGGIKSKVLAAHRGGIERVILPERNRVDLEDIPEQVREDMEIGFATDMSEVIDFALEPMGSVVSPAAGEGPQAPAH
jgi:ATP-dependent Lon protease